MHYCAITHTLFNIWRNLKTHLLTGKIPNYWSIFPKQGRTRKKRRNPLCGNTLSSSKRKIFLMAVIAARLRVMCKMVEILTDEIYMLVIVRHIFLFLFPKLQIESIRQHFNNSEQNKAQLAGRFKYMTTIGDYLKLQH